MTTKLLFLCTVIGTLWCMPAQAQFKCGGDEITEYLNTHPDALARKQLAEAMLKATSHQRAGFDTTDGKYVIPLVFHIIHNYGPENIADSQIVDAVRWLNLCYNMQDPKRNLIIPTFQPLEANVHVTFKLANKDPQGNYTNGIEHIASLKTFAGGEIAKLNPWPNDSYINVWVVAALPDNAAGYAYLPGDVEGLGGLRDGVIILYDYVGGVGKSSEYNARALPHEIGHMLNLKHPWGNGNVCEAACGDDDIEDTPETKGFCPGHCPTPTSAKICHMTLQNGPTDTGVIENYQNYMDYSYCSRMFTKGQRDAMLNTLNNSIAGRNNLWSPFNQTFTGIDYDPPVAAKPKADFSVNTQMVCQGDAVTFKNASYREATNYNWTFEDATPSTSTAADPQVTFNSPGWHTATLVADNGSDADTLTRTEYVYVSNSYSDYNSSYQEAFEDTPTFNHDWLLMNKDNNASHWQLDPTVGANSATSIYLNNFNNTIGDIDEMISPAIDLTQATPASIYFTFDYASATLASSSTQIKDSMFLYYSNSCGKTWIRFDTLAGANLITNGVDWTAFKPAGGWKPFSVQLPAAAYGPLTRFKIQYRSGGNGNNIYLDNINISTFTGIDQLAANVNDFNLFPNPATSSFQLAYHLAKESKVKIELMDAFGRSVQVLADEKQASGSHTFNTDESTVGQLSQGIYMVKLTADGSSISKRLAITK